MLLFLGDDSFRSVCSCDFTRFHDIILKVEDAFFANRDNTSVGHARCAYSLLNFGQNSLIFIKNRLPIFLELRSRPPSNYPVRPCLRSQLRRKQPINTDGSGGAER